MYGSLSWASDQRVRSGVLRFPSGSSWPQEEADVGIGYWPCCQGPRLQVCSSTSSFGHGTATDWAYQSSRKRRASSQRFFLPTTRCCMPGALPVRSQSFTRFVLRTRRWSLVGLAALPLLRRSAQHHFSWLTQEAQKNPAWWNRGVLEWRRVHIRPRPTKPSLSRRVPELAAGRWGASAQFGQSLSRGTPVWSRRRSFEKPLEVTPFLVSPLGLLIRRPEH